VATPYPTKKQTRICASFGGRKRGESWKEKRATTSTITSHTHNANMFDLQLEVLDDSPVQGGGADFTPRQHLKNMDTDRNYKDNTRRL
jgi:hypothetical protein